MGNLQMCKFCHKAVGEQKFSQLEDNIGGFDATEMNVNFFVTRCPRCGQLWETHAYQPSYSQKISPEEARDKYPNIVLPPFRKGVAAKIRRWLGI
jgi:hypothetical protein